MPISQSHSDWVIVGAGLSGAVLFHALSSRGIRPLILEKSRGVGGRIANRRIGSLAFHHGVREFKFDQPEDEVLLFSVFESMDFEIIGDLHYGIKSPATQMIKRILPESQVLKEAKVVQIERLPEGALFLLILESGESVTAANVILTAPAPQTVELAGKWIEPFNLNLLERVTYSKRIILFSSGHEPKMEFMDDGFSSEHFEKTDTEILALEASGRFDSVKKWRYENVIQGVNADFISESGIHLCGDYFNSRPNRGVASSLRSASHLLAHLGFPLKIS